MGFIITILVLLAVLAICILGMFVIASVVTMISAFGEAYDDLHSEEDYFENYKAKR